MSPSEKSPDRTEKLLVRNILGRVFDALQRKAVTNDRSTEAEARQAIKAWVSDSLAFEDQPRRLREVAERLNYMLDTINRGVNGKLKISHIAERAGMERAVYLERVFAGIEEPAFSELRQIANLLHVSESWLLHGEGATFSVRRDYPTQEPKKCVEWLFAPHPELLELDSIYFVRENSPEGTLAICRVFQDGEGKGGIPVIETTTTTIHVSTVVGGTGTTNLVHLLITLEIVYRIYTGASDMAKVLVSGYELDPEDFNALVCGKAYPLAVLDRATRSTWWEDILTRGCEARIVTGKIGMRL